MRRHDVVKALALSLCLTTAAPAVAQLLFIPSIVTNIIGNRAAAKRERACYAGRPSVQEARAPTDIETLLATYVAGAAQADTKGVAALFSKQVDAMWKRTDGRGGIFAVDDPMARALATDPPTAQLAAETLVIAGDGSSAWGTWLARPLATGGPSPVRYIIDFTREGGKWRLYHVYLKKPESTFTVPIPYCHRPGDRAPPPSRGDFPYDPEQMLSGNIGNTAPPATPPAKTP